MTNDDNEFFEHLLEEYELTEGKDYNYEQGIAFYQDI